MQFRYRNRVTGERLGKISVEFTINREDLIAACAHEISEQIGLYEPHVADFDRVAATMTKARVEKRLRWLINSYGTLWQESNSSDYLTVWSGLHDTLNDIAADTVDRLFPELVRVPS